jgi:lipid-A-disaccharide synthase-like uncharacterized protein
MRQKKIPARMHMQLQMQRAQRMKMRFGVFADPGFFVGCRASLLFSARAIHPYKNQKAEQRKASELSFWLSVLQPLALSLYRSTET